MPDDGFRFLNIIKFLKRHKNTKDGDLARSNYIAKRFNAQKDGIKQCYPRHFLQEYAKGQIVIGPPPNHLV